MRRNLNQIRGRRLDIKCYKEDKHRERNNPNGKTKYFATEMEML